MSITPKLEVADLLHIAKVLYQHAADQRCTTSARQQSARLGDKLLIIINHTQAIVETK